MTTLVPAVPALSPSPPAAPGAAPLPLVDVTATSRRAARRRELPRGLRRLTGPLVLLAAWAVASTTGWLDPQLMPPPQEVLQAAGRLVTEGSALTHLWASLQRVLAGVVLGVVAGGLLAVLAGLTRLGEDLLDSTMQIFKAVPNFALTPLLIIWMGIGEGPKVLLITLGVAIAIYVNTYGAIRGVDAQLVEVARTLDLGRIALVRHVVLPGAMPGFPRRAAAGDAQRLAQPDLRRDDQHHRGSSVT